MSNKNTYPHHASRMCHICHMWVWLDIWLQVTEFESVERHMTTMLTVRHHI